MATLPAPEHRVRGARAQAPPPPTLLVALGQPLAPLRGELLARGRSPAPAARGRPQRQPAGLLLGRQGQVARGARRSSARAAGLREPGLPAHGRKDAVLPGRRDASTGGGGDARREEGMPARGESGAGAERGMLAGRGECLPAREVGRAGDAGRIRHGRAARRRRRRGRAPAGAAAPPPP